MIHPLVGSLLLALALLAACASETASDAAADSDARDTVASNTIEVTPIDSSLHDSLRAIERRSGGKLGFAAIHIESGWRTVYGGGETYPMASVAKLPMALAFLRDVERGRSRLDSVVELTRADHRPGLSRIYHRVMKDSAGRVQIHHMLASMLIESDNTASDYILRLAGGPASAQTLMRELGLNDINVTSYEGELILKWAGIDPLSSDSAWTRDRIYTKIQDAGKIAWDNAQAMLVDDPHDAAPPDALARLLVLIAEGKVLKQPMTDSVLAIMSRAVTGRNRIRGMLPVGTPVADKTGTIGSVANDVGIITLPGNRGRLVVVAMVKASTSGARARDAAIASASRLVYEHVMAR